MKLKLLDIYNYRQFIHQSIYMEDGITFLAGANNSGKTSIIELMNRLFGETSVKISTNDLPVEMYNKWIEDCENLIRDSYGTAKEKKEFIKMLQDKLIGSVDNPTEFSKQIEQGSMKVKLEIGYEKEDIIELFSPYLMDLDEKTYRFYFLYQYKFIPNLFINLLDKQFEKCERTLKGILEKKETEEGKENSNEEAKLEQFVIHILEQCYRGQYFYADKNYENLQKIEEPKDFYKLFHYKHIWANRDMPDEKGDKKKKNISTAMIDFIGKEKWERVFEEGPDSIMDLIYKVDIQGNITANLLGELNAVMTDISQTNGGRKEAIVIEPDVTDADIKELLQNVSKAKYKIEGYQYYFGEETQGLGYSNMIYMHLQLQKYLKELEDEEQKKKVNFFVIEEPEAHMHPQMQKEFVRYLLKMYKDKKMQGIVTTHASEVVRIAGISAIRVVRKTPQIFEKRICDMCMFLNDLNLNKKDIENEYNILYQINFADIIFADKVIMFEGDTERMYLKRLLQRTEYRALEQQYIAFVQVGGAYTHWYRELIEFLKIKTLILTDIDYEKQEKTIDKIKESYTSNGGLKDYYLHQKEKTKDTSKLKIKDLYEWQNMGENKIGDYIMVSFQGEKDGCTRTLEEAMLAKLYDLNIEDTLSRVDWEKKQEDSRLQFKIPKSNNKNFEQEIGKTEILEQTNEKLSVREIVSATSSYKTDFIYSVLLNEKEKDVLPSYIEEGLKWLTK